MNWEISWKNLKAKGVLFVYKKTKLGYSAVSMNNSGWNQSLKGHGPFPLFMCAKSGFMNRSLLVSKLLQHRHWWGREFDGKKWLKLRNTTFMHVI